MRLGRVSTDLVPEVKRGQRKPGAAVCLCEDEIIKQKKIPTLKACYSQIESRWKAFRRNSGWIVFKQIKDFAWEYIFHLIQRGSPTTGGLQVMTYGSSIMVLFWENGTKTCHHPGETVRRLRQGWVYSFETESRAKGSDDSRWTEMTL